MSTYYYAVCDVHRVVSEVIGGRSFPSCWWQKNNNELADFLEQHAGCGNDSQSPRIVSEHSDVVYEYTRLTSQSTEHEGANVAD